MTWYLFIISIIVNVMLCKGFLLETGKTQNTTGQPNVPYLTVSGYLEDKRQQQHEMDRIFNLLTSQVQQKLGEFENKINQQNAKGTETNNLETTWEKRYLDLEKKYSTLQTNFNRVNSSFLLQEQAFKVLQNKTIDLETKVSSLENLKQFQSFQNISNLQQTIQSIDANVLSLRTNEQARSQDFLALHNETLATKHRISDLEMQTNGHFHQVELQLNSAVSDLKNKLETVNNKTVLSMNSQVQTFTNYFNASLESLVNNLRGIKANESSEFQQIQNEIARIKDKVTVTACASNDHTYNGGEIIKFPTVKTHTGGSRLSLQSNGKFTCKKKGVYLVSVWIMSNTLSDGIHMKKNGVSFVYSDFHHSAGYEKGTVIVAIDLNVNDEIWIETNNPFEVDFWGSCITISEI